MRIIDTLLLLILLCLAVFLIRLDIREARQLRSFSGSSRVPFEISGTFQFSEGYDENGASISALPLRFKSLMFFVLHGSRFQSDVDFWNAARAENTNQGDVGFVGVCDGPECSRRLLSPMSGIQFMLVNSGDYLGMKALLRADAEGQILVMEFPSRRTHKSTYPKSLADLSKLRLGAVK